MAAAASAADGSVFVYLQPLPQEAARLSFALGSVSIVSDGGAEHALDVGLRSIDASTAGRQRLLGTAHLPAGRYTKLSTRIRQASLKSATGAAALATSTDPVVTPIEFTVLAGRTSVLWVQFTYDGSIADGYRFEPIFTVVTPSAPVISRAAFVASAAANAVLVVDKSSAFVVGAVDTCAHPSGLALDQQRRLLYVACSAGDEVDTIDVASQRVVERLPLSPGDAPQEAALTPDGTTLVCVNAHSNTVTLLRTSPLTVLERISVGSGPGSLVIAPTGSRAFVFNTLSGSISVVDISRRIVVATIATDSAPLRGQFNSTGDRLVVIYERSPYIVVLDPIRLNVITRTRLHAGIDCLKADNRRDLLYTGGLRDRLIEFYNPTALLPIDAMSIPGGAAYLTIDAADDRLWIASPDTKRVLVGSLATRKVVAEIDVGDGPTWVSVMGEK
jgi:YVTN family beta-propeller protein